MDVRQLAFLARQPSSALTPRETFWGMPKRGIALILANAMFWQPLWAQADGIAVSGSTNTSLSQAGNGVPIVNIAAPNASGLSHNQYQQYNVDAKGVILNNINQQTGSTQLGGIIVGNSNLRGNAAATILNEVVGANATQLKGYTEVAGQAARVIVANPYGISCNGCGFINTPQVTLTTGKPMLDGSGRLERFNVQGGSISIDGLGLNAENVEQFDIITRSAKINAELHARKLNIITGRNNVDAQTLTATALPDDGSAKPELAIDSSALGGMYAGAIRLVGTDAGVGVRLAGDLAANGGDIQIDANGHLSMAQAAASSAVAIKAGTAEINGALYAGSSLAVTTTGDLTARQNIAARDAVTLSAGGQLTNMAVIEAGVNPDNGRNASGDVTLSAKGISNRGSISASRAVQATITQTLDNQGATLSGQSSTRIVAASVDNRQSGRILSQSGSVDITARQISNAGSGLVSSSGDLTITADALDNSQQGRIVSSSGLSARISGQLLNQLGIMSASGDLQLNAGTLDNRSAEVSSLSRLTANVGQLTNTGNGSFYAKNKLGLTVSGAVNNSQGVLRSDGMLDLSAASLINNAGIISSSGASTLIIDGLANNRGGQITSDANLTITAASLDNSQKGKLFGKGSTQITAGLFDNSQSGSLTSSDTLWLMAGKVINQNAGRIASALALTASVTSLDQQAGELFSNTSLSLDLNNGQLNNQGGLINAPGALLLKNLNGVVNQNGEISSAQAFTLKARSLDNADGKLLSNQALTLIVDKALNNVKGTISAAALNLDSGSLDNREGLISSRAELDVTVDTALTNVKGTLISDGKLELDAATVDNGLGQIASKQNLNARIGSFQQQGGQMLAQGALTLTGNTLDNRLDGFIGATNTLDINVLEIDNRGGELSSQEAITLTGQQLNNSDNGRVLAQQTLSLSVAQITNRDDGLISSKAALKLVGSTLDNTGGAVSALSGVNIDLSSVLDNSQGLINSEETLTLKVGSLTNTAGSVSSAGNLAIDSLSSISNQGGQLVTDSALDLHSANVDNTRQGNISGKGPLTLRTGNFDNSDGGRLSSGDLLALTAAKLTNRSGGSIGSGQALTVNVSSLDQQGGSLFSNTSLSLDLNNGQLNNQNGLINSPGALLLKNVNDVLNQNGEISSAQAFTLDAQQIDNSGGKLLSNQSLTLRVARALDNVKGMIAAAGVDASVNTLNNSGGTLTSRDDLVLTVTGLLTNSDNGLINAVQVLDVGAVSLDNQNGQLLGGTRLSLNATSINNTSAGLINSAGTLELTANSLKSGSGGEVSASSDMTLVLNSMSLNAGRVISDAGLSIELNGNDLDNRGGLITATGPLTFSGLRDLDNQSGEISSAHSFTMNARTLNNNSGKLISSNVLTVDAMSLLNQNGLISGWQGLSVSGNRLDNRNSGTLSSRNGNLDAVLTGELLNGANGALVSQKTLTVSADSLDNRGGILSSGTDQRLTVAGLLDNSQNGLIDSGAGLVIKANTLSNAAGNLTAQQDFSFEGLSLDNSAGNLSSTGSITLDLLDTLTNASGKLASGRALLLRRSAAINNQAGQLVSQSLMTLNTSSDLDNRNRGTVAANANLILNAGGSVLNDGDGLIYSQSADLEVQAAGLSNVSGTLQSQGTLRINVTGDIDNRNGRIISQDNDLNVTAANLDSRGGVLSSLQGMFTANVTGLMKNGYDVIRQGGVIQAQRLNLNALGGFDNYGGRISARTGEALISTANFDNRNGGLYAKGLVRVTGTNFDNSGDNDGQIAAGQVELKLSGALNNQLGIIESDSTLAVTAASLDNQTGQLRALGSSGTTSFQIGNLFDNRNGKLEVANSGLILKAASFRNGNGSLLHNGEGTFDISTANLTNAGGNIVTRGGLTLTADNWTNSSVIQAGRLTVNVGTLNQTASGQLLGSTSFTGTGGNWTNNGLIASDGAVDIRLGGTYSGSGRLSSLGSMNLTANQLALNSSGNIAGGARSELNIAGAATNYNRITSVGDLVFNAGAINNYGTVSSEKNLTLKTPALVNERGLLFSGQNMNLLVGDLTNQNSSIYGFGNLGISGVSGGAAGNIKNLASSINVDGDFSLSSAFFLNKTEAILGKETLISGDITYECQRSGGCKWVNYYIEEHWESESTTIGDNALVSVGGDFTANVGSFSNFASVISAGKNIKLNVGDFDNTAVESGTFTKTLVYNARVYDLFDLVDEKRGAITAYNRRNSKYVHTYTTDVCNGDSGCGLEPIRRAEQTTNELNPYFGTGAQVSVPDRIFTYDYVGGSTVFTGTSGTPSVIQAGKLVEVNATGTIKNGNLQVNSDFLSVSKNPPSTGGGSKGAIPFTRINAQLPPDLAQQQVNPLSLPGFSLPTGQNGLFRLSGQSGTTASVAQPVGQPQTWAIGGAAVSVAQRELSVPDTQASNFQIQSVGEISNVPRQLGLGALSANNPNPAGATGFVNGNLVTAITPTASAALQTVKRVQGLPSSSFVSKPQKYLIETNPVLTELKQFMSSDYLLAGLGYNPEVSAKRLGDGLYEQRLVQQAILARTGQAFIKGQTSNEDQFKYLMSNAIASKDKLNLAVGVSLSSQQVAALTHDIVWLEEHEVNGEKVLVPVLYLAQADNRLGPTGALIAGSDLSLIAGQDLGNVGTLRATNNLSAIAGNNLVNAGLIEAGDRLDLLAVNDLTNKAGGIIAGRDVSLTSLSGDLINERTVTAADNDLNGQRHSEFADSAARVEAANDMRLSAGRDVINRGSVLESGRDMKIQAGRDLTLGPTEVTNSAYISSRSNSSNITQLGSTIKVGRDMTAQADRNIAIIASQIDVKRDIAMAATENLLISSAADEEHSLSKSKKLTRQEDHVSQVISDLNAGGSVALQAGQNLTVISSQITAGQEAYLVAGENLDILAAQDSDYSLYDKKKKGSFGSGKTRRDEVTDV
ncbi:filamentous hemagglutinin N-terminal domain-containing protein, partial [Pseudomonas folii]